MTEKEFIFVVFECDNPDCVRVSGEVNFDGAHFVVGEELPTDFRCSVCEGTTHIKLIKEA